MSAEAYRNEEMYHENEPKVINIKRNPYLVDYEQQRRLRSQGEQGVFQRTASQGARRTARIAQEEQWEQEIRKGQEFREEREIRRMPRRGQEFQEEREIRRMPRRGQEFQEEREIRRASRKAQQESQRTQGVQQAQRYERTSREETVQGGSIDLYSDEQSLNQKKRAAIARKRAAARRKRIVMLQRMVLFTGVFCIALLCGILYMKRIDAKTTEPENKVADNKISNEILPTVASSGLVQGISETEYAKHPEWEEKFLTPNEYSRPGEALEEVTNIFVHYTANPNTSAAQNRSYFEQLKDTHVTSASAHFIIGYNGEIIQCIPLDEIAYAVQTRNYDSISIECCYKSADGSFTQETYDSLIELLAWLTDVYDLTADDILRHYDCGGKKCPIYYTEHEDAWELLKRDVAEKL